MKAFRLPLFALILLAAACGGGDAELRFDAELPSDVQALAGETWQAFVATFPAHLDCIPDVTLVGAWEFDERARYDPDSATITLRIPATAGQLETALVHEFGHHLDFHCAAGVRDIFKAAQGIDPSVDWAAGPDGAAWEDVPAEQFAEATILAVLDYRLANRQVPVSPAAVSVLREWGQGAAQP